MPGRRCCAISFGGATMKRMSGSFVLLSGVGTQMMTASAREHAEVGGGASLRAWTSGETRSGDVADVGLAGVERRTLRAS